MRDLIEAIAKKHAWFKVAPKGAVPVVNPPATPEAIAAFEKKVGFQLPDDFREFYSFCNGFGVDEDIFNMNSLEDVLSYESHYGENWFHFAEYMINSEMWTVRIKPSGAYEIIYDTENLVLTGSLNEFLSHFLEGNVFDYGGLMYWSNNLK